MQYFFGMPACMDTAWCTEMASVAQWCKGGGLDPGAGHRTFSPEVVTMDALSDEARVRGRAESLPFADGSFDFVITSHLLEHLQDTRGALLEWLRVVKVGGYVVNIIPDVRFTHGMNTDATPHLHEWGPNEFLREILECPIGDMWYKVAPFRWGTAEVVSFDEALPGWSFHCVLRRTDGNGIGVEAIAN